VNRNPKRLLSIAAAAIAVAAVAVMYIRHTGEAPGVAPMRAQLSAPQVSDDAIAAAIRQANVRIDGLVARNVGGIVVLRGAAEAAAAEKAVEAVKQLGFTRVANLIRPTSFDDEGIRRNAERQLAQTRALDGCVLKVSCNRGVLSVSGTVQSELQADAARLVLRSVAGAHEVKVDLQKL
jgi:osmotically-inducible protein OsmY